MSRPLVAIVGRPNVGKSMLFNRLAGRRLSIVEDTPGVTRDRLYAECEWNGRKFDIVDTGGIEPTADSEILHVHARAGADSHRRGGRHRPGHGDRHRRHGCGQDRGRHAQALGQARDPGREQDGLHRRRGPGLLRVLFPRPRRPHRRLVRARPRHGRPAGRVRGALPAGGAPDEDGRPHPRRRHRQAQRGQELAHKPHPGREARHSLQRGGHHARRGGYAFREQVRQIRVYRYGGHTPPQQGGRQDREVLCHARETGY